MTYSLLSLTSGSLIGSYDTEERAWEYIRRLYDSEPETLPTLAFVAFDDTGFPTETIEGDELRGRLFASSREATIA